MPIRLYTPCTFHSGENVHLSEDQWHYLLHVMRLKTGDSVFVFNGLQGEWEAVLRNSVQEDTQKKGAGKKKKDAVQGELILKEQFAPHLAPADVWLCFALIKKAPMEFLVQKATELGVGDLKPLITHYTQPQPFKKDRLDTIAVEAAEQCRLTALPVVHEPVSLKEMLESWPSNRMILFCDERTAKEGGNPLDTLKQYQGQNKPWGIVIGPEGGFSTQEQALIRNHPNSVSINLGKRVMRAETAGISALTLWQACLGDWS